LVYPLLESGIFLACTNWSWHAYIDPNDVTNEYVQSITIVNGEMNILNEDAHVVHHQYPGVHWTDHPKLLEKHGESYGDNTPGSVFFHTHAFELFFFAVTRNYGALADRFVGDVKDPKTGKYLNLGFSSQTKPEGSLPREEVIQLLKDRLRVCWWGPRAKAGTEAGRILAKDLGLAKGTVQAAEMEAEEARRKGSPAEESPKRTGRTTNDENSMFTGVLAVVILAVVMAVVNATIVYNMKDILLQHIPKGASMLNIVPSVDILANIIYLSVTVIGAVLIDAKALLHMFVDTRMVANGCCSSRSGAVKTTNPFVSLFGLAEYEGSAQTITVVVNWMAANGVCAAATKAWMNLPLDNYPTMQNISPALARDLVMGNLQINPFIRSLNWESIYGLMCVTYLSTYFGLSVVNRANFRARKLPMKGTFYSVFTLGLATFSGILAGDGIALGWLLGSIHVGALCLACSRGAALAASAKQE